MLNVRLGSDLELITLSGMIDVKTAGRLQAQTDRGKVVAVLQAPNWLGENTVRSKTGQIEIWLSRDASAAVDAETSGWLTTDYSVEIQHDEAAGRKIIRARVGQGQSQLRGALDQWCHPFASLALTDMIATTDRCNVTRHARNSS